jgi:protein-S-isoprenylcysteine O-methyltransferase Ste14
LLLLLQLVIEERMLLERYGQVYQDYKAKITKKFFPFVY